MKRFATITLTVALSSAGFAVAQSGGMNNMSTDSKARGDMNGMDMKGMGMKGQGSVGKNEIHVANATVKSVDPSKGTVTLSHEPVKSLKWPAMAMGFSVKDMALFDKLAVGNKVQVEFVQQGEKYVVTSVK